MAKQIEYFVAPQSPYAYLGHERFVAIAKKHDAQVLLKPFDAVKIFSVSGGIPVSQRPPQRQAYRLTELQRWSTFLQQPLNLHPAFFPVSGDPGAKFIIATQLAHGTETALKLAGAIGRAVWAEEKNIADETVLATLADNLDLDGKQLLAASLTEGVAADYARFTDEAMAANVFGIPWYRINGENFWGQDRLEFVERALAV
jgi:2-hydroxychromene-2-carboxylate isomerase